MKTMFIENHILLSHTQPYIARLDALHYLKNEKYIKKSTSVLISSTDPVDRRLGYHLIRRTRSHTTLCPVNDIFSGNQKTLSDLAVTLGLENRLIQQPPIPNKILNRLLRTIEKTKGELCASQFYFRYKSIFNSCADLRPRKYMGPDCIKLEFYSGSLWQWSRYANIFFEETLKTLESVIPPYNSESAQHCKSLFSKVGGHDSVVPGELRFDLRGTRAKKILFRTSSVQRKFYIACVIVSAANSPDRKSKILKWVEDLAPLPFKDFVIFVLKIYEKECQKRKRKSDTKKHYLKRRDQSGIDSPICKSVTNCVTNYIIKYIDDLIVNTPKKFCLGDDDQFKRLITWQLAHFDNQTARAPVFLTELFLNYPAQQWWPLIRDDYIRVVERITQNRRKSADTGRLLYHTSTIPVFWKHLDVKTIDMIVRDLMRRKPEVFFTSVKMWAYLPWDDAYPQIITMRKHSDEDVRTTATLTLKKLTERHPGKEWDYILAESYFPDKQQVRWNIRQPRFVSVTNYQEYFEMPFAEFTSTADYIEFHTGIKDLKCIPRFVLDETVSPKMAVELVDYVLTHGGRKIRSRKRAFKAYCRENIDSILPILSILIHFERHPSFFILRERVNYTQSTLGVTLRGQQPAGQVSNPTQRAYAILNSISSKFESIDIEPEQYIDDLGPWSWDREPRVYFRHDLAYLKKLRFHWDSQNQLAKMRTLPSETAITNMEGPQIPKELKRYLQTNSDAISEFMSQRKAKGKVSHGWPIGLFTETEIGRRIHLHWNFGGYRNPEMNHALSLLFTVIRSPNHDNYWSKKSLPWQLSLSGKLALSRMSREQIIGYLTNFEYPNHRLVRWARLYQPDSAIFNAILKIRAKTSELNDILSPAKLNSLLHIALTGSKAKFKQLVENVAYGPIVEPNFSELLCLQRTKQYSLHQTDIDKIMAKFMPNDLPLKHLSDLKVAVILGFAMRYKARLFDNFELLDYVSNNWLERGSVARRVLYRLLSTRLSRDKMKMRRWRTRAYQDPCRKIAFTCLRRDLFDLFSPIEEVASVLGLHLHRFNLNDIFTGHSTIGMDKEYAWRLFDNICQLNPAASVQFDSIEFRVHLPPAMISNFLVYKYRAEILTASNLRDFPEATEEVYRLFCNEADSKPYNMKLYGPECDPEGTSHISSISQIPLPLKVGFIQSHPNPEIRIKLIEECDDRLIFHLINQSILDSLDLTVLPKILEKKIVPLINLLEPHLKDPLDIRSFLRGSQFEISQNGITPFAWIIYGKWIFFNACQRLSPDEYEVINTSMNKVNLIIWPIPKARIKC